jgi:hypothetical protein
MKKKYATKNRLTENDTILTSLLLAFQISMSIVNKKCS